MRRILLAVRAFFRILCNADTAARAALVLDGPEVPAIEVAPAAKGPAGPRQKPSATARAAARSEALTLLATLQREARFVDFIQEPLVGYSDAQIGAAAREVHRDCSKVFERLFALRPVVAGEEGAEVELEAAFDAGRYRLLGNVGGEPPLRGRLVHHGWEATGCELPLWSGSATSARVVAPAEVELK